MSYVEDLVVAIETAGVKVATSVPDQSDRDRVETLIKLPPGTNSDDWSEGGK